MKNLIKQILREETSLITLRRRLTHLDDEVQLAISTFNMLNNTVCIGVQPFISMIRDIVIDSMYYTYFANLNETSKEWEELVELIDEYLETHYTPKLTEYYHSKCGE